MNNQILGYNYEIQVRDYIISQNKMAYLWSHTPENILIEHNIIGSHNIARLKRKETRLNPLIDTGIDIIQLENNILSLVQCKNGYKKGLTINDLAGFMCWMAHMDKLNGYVYYTDKLSTNLKSLPSNPRVKYIKHSYIEPIIEQISDKFIIDKDKLKYQMEAYESAKEYYQENMNGIISMPCGTGKTYVSYLIKKLFRQVIILSPLKQFAKQNLDRYIEYGYKHSTLLVDSDGCRDVEYIKEFINNNRRFVISATYDSIDVIYECIDLMYKPFFIIDEFHNLSKNNVTNEGDIFYKVINSKHRKLFMSATPRVYEMEHDNSNNNDYNHLFYDVVFGSTIYNMSFTDAIKSNYITDYTIWLPSIHENTELLDKDLSIYDIDDVIKSKCKFLYSCLVNNGSRKCIIYCTDTNEITNMMNAIEKLDDYYCLDYHMDYITSNISHKKRDTILKTFASSPKIELLFSCRILDECIDIPSCDSIFITYPSQSKIRTIQRLCRCIRIDTKNKYKKGNIFIWCDEYSKILETLSGIKEYDVEFRDKIKLNINGHHGISEDKGLIDDKKLIGDYTMGIKEFKDISWDDKLDMVKQYIDENNCRPSSSSKDNNTRQLAIWVSHQIKNYKHKKEIMKNKYYFDKWTDFLNKYKEYFLSNEEKWINNIEKVKSYISKNNKVPSQYDEDNNIKQLGAWVTQQKIKYNKRKGIMVNDIYYNKWTNFINEYKEYFLSNEEIWINNLDKVKIYINENNKIPSIKDKDSNIKQLKSWITNQKTNYKKKENIMTNDIYYNKWTEFIDEYKEYFQNNEEIWINNIEKVKKYISENNKVPSQHNKDNNIKQLGAWISTQIKTYNKRENIMANDSIYNKWTEFMNEYKEYFLSNEEIWINNIEKVKSYISEHTKSPSTEDKDNNIKQLGSWIYTQTQNYNKRENIMANDIYYNKWSEFINEYKQYFQSNEEKWINNLDKVKNYIYENNKAPTEYDKDSNIKSLGQWFSQQKIKYNKKINIMANNIYYNKWTEFMNEYKEYFQSNEEKWNNNIEKVKSYISENNKKPNTEDKDSNIKQLGAWISTQIKTYNKRENIMANDSIYNKWTEFMNEYKEYFLSNEEIWINNIEMVKKYINKNNKRPSESDKDINIKQLGCWIVQQKIKYKKKVNIMTNNIIYNKMTEFINEYKEYFLSNEEIWEKKLEDVKKYINKNNKKPFRSDKDSNIKQLGNWIHTQKNNYNKRRDIMANNIYYNKWTAFINDPLYKKYFD